MMFDSVLKCFRVFSSVSECFPLLMSSMSLEKINFCFRKNKIKSIDEILDYHVNNTRRKSNHKYSNHDPPKMCHPTICTTSPHSMCTHSDSVLEYCISFYSIL